ncbi:MAG TPA: Fe-S cluster assembly protein HesB [Candidatus Dormibacteraeota bacterium]|nr:Fe-S cluster assembly protein HesB [Candidatus Dormibacteraeota bacterium]
MVESWTAEFPLVGPAGEAIDLRRVFLSHGIAELPPMRLDQKAWTFEITVPVAGVGARTLTISQARPGHGLISVAGQSLTPRVAAAVMAQVRHVLSLDLDLTPFYAVAAEDPDLAWVLMGAGRMVRSPTVFEDVVKTICTTNTSWGGTTRMVNALVEHLGEKAPGAPGGGPYGRAFPTPAAMAAAPAGFYKKVAGAGYRGPYLKTLATDVARGRVNLESLASASRDDLPDDEVAARLLALPGVGPYAAAHIMLMLGRYDRLILDSWTRPTYARLLGRKRPVSDRAIERRFKRYGPYAGLAFWLFLTRNWLPDDAP